MKELSDLTGKKILPNLKLNIRCGNSLIYGERVIEETGLFWREHENDIVELNNSRKLFHTEKDDSKQTAIFNHIQVIEKSINKKLNKQLELYFINNVNLYKPMNFEIAFSEVFEQGGFDCIIGNPPYIDSELMTKEQFKERNFIAKKYETAKGNWDIYIAFLERAYKLTNENGYWSFITPDKWISKSFGKAYRVKTKSNLRSILKVGRKVFKDAKVDAIVSVFNKKISNKLKIDDFVNDEIQEINVITKGKVDAEKGYDFMFSKYLELIHKIEDIQGEKITFNSEGACATSDAYALKPLLEENTDSNVDTENYYKVINTGTTNKFISRWGHKKMTYLGKKYLYPVVANVK